MTAKIKVLHVVGDPIGGIRKHIHSILTGLDPSRFEQSYAYSPDGGDALFFDELPGLRETLSGRLLVLNVRKRPSLSDLTNLRKLRRFAAKNGADVVHGHGAKGGVYARLLGKLLGARSVYTPHGGSIHRMFHPAEDFLYRAAESSLRGLTDLFVFESQYTAEAYAAKAGGSPRRWLVNHSGVAPVDSSRAERKALELGYRPAGRLRLGVFGALRGVKGQIFAVQAAAELMRRGRPVELHLFGDGPDRGLLQGEALRLGLGDGVVFHGDVIDVEGHMRGMDVVLLPSRFESFGYAAIEAFSHGKPVVASAVGGLREVVADESCGFLVPPESPAAIADAVVRYSNDSGLLQRHGEEAEKRFVSMFHQGRMLAGLAEVYEALAHHGSLVPSHSRSKYS